MADENTLNDVTNIEGKMPGYVWRLCALIFNVKLKNSDVVPCANNMY